MLIIWRSNCTNTASGIVTLCKWPSGMQVESSLSTCKPDGHLKRVTIPDAVLVQFDLLMMSTTLLETCRGLLKMYYKIKNLCIKLVIYKSYTKMHGQQHIKICNGVVMKTYIF